MDDLNENDLRIDVYQNAGGNYAWCMRMVHVPTGIVAESEMCPGRGEGARSRFTVRAELMGEIRRRLNE